MDYSRVAIHGHKVENCPRELSAVDFSKLSKPLPLLNDLPHLLGDEYPKVSDCPFLPFDGSYHYGGLARVDFHTPHPMRCRFLKETGKLDG